MLSIITINLNNHDGLVKTINSLAQQNTMQFELIVIDGGSTDGSLDLIHECSNLFPRFLGISEPDRGIYDAMNKGIDLCTGDFVSFLNSGDVFLRSEYLSDVLEFISAETPTIGFYSDIIIQSRRGTVDRFWRSYKFSYILFYVFGWVPPHPSTFIKLSILKELKFNSQYRIAGDYDFFLRLIKNFGFPSYFDTIAVSMEGAGVSSANFKSIYNANLEVISSWRTVFGFSPFWLLFLKPFFKLTQKFFPLFRNY